MLPSRHAAVALAVSSLLLGATACIRQPLELTTNDAPVVLSHQSITAPNPGQPGTYTVRTLVYGSGTDKRRAAFRDSVTLKTKSVDGSPMVSAPPDIAKDRAKYWGFDFKKLPINGHVWYPQGDGPFPLVMAAASPFLGWLAGRIGSRALLIGGSAVVGAGLLLGARIGGAGGYWTTVLPPILIVAVGMSGVAAPLTNAVLGSVDARHTGEASGLNSAVARSGGLIATALIGGVLASGGGALTGGFHLAMLAFAGACFTAAAIGVVLVRGPRPAGAD